MISKLTQRVHVLPTEKTTIKNPARELGYRHPL